MTNTLESPPLPSNQKFGWIFSIIWAVGGCYAKWKMVTVWVGPLFLLMVAFAILAAFAPKMLGPLNRFWYSLGIRLGQIISPIVLGIIFFLLITPIAIAGRISGRDALKMKKRNVASYWIARETPSPEQASYKNQF